ncbi:MAG TPA: DNA alkylation repair protein [Nitrososphaerales archaeon]|nr:DNA alkylation repair protein [Nitrososphaerales archaeon]
MKRARDPRKTELSAVLSKLEAMGDPRSLVGMARFGINTARAYGVSIPKVRSVAKEVGRDHSLALKLWSSGIHEARILAAMIDDPELVTERQMESWVKDFDSWDVCDSCCGSLFDRTGFAYRKAIEWSSRKEEYERRAGFVLMAELAVHDKQAGDEKFKEFLAIIGKSDDERNFVKKAINWALRQIGKRNLVLNKLAIATARKMEKRESRSARWIASDALRELSDDKVRSRITLRENQKLEGRASKKG